MQNKKICKILFISTLFLFFLVFLLETNFLHVIYNFIFNSEYRYEMSETYNSSNIFLNLLNTISDNMQNFDFSFNYILIWSSNLFQIMPPFFAILGIFSYFNETSIKKIFEKSFNFSVFVFLAYVFFMIFIIVICNGKNDLTIQRDLFTDLFGNEFYNSHIYIYYFLCGILKFFVIPFIYISIGLILSSKFKSKMESSFLIMWSYFSISLIFSTLAEIIDFKLIYLSPMLIMVSESYNNISTLLLILYNILLMSFFIILFKLKIDKFCLNLNIIRIFYLTYIIIVFLLSRLNNVSILDNLYMSPSLFIQYLLVSMFSIQNIDKNYKGNSFYNISLMKKNIEFNFKFTFSLFVINIILFIFLKCTFSLYDMTVLSLNLFLILTVLQVFVLVLDFNNKNFTRKYIFLLIMYLLFILTYMYGDNLFLLNFYFQLFKNNTSSYMIIHYILWLIVPLFIIHAIRLRSRKVIK